MLIVCNGMYRAGSTLQYNLVSSLVTETRQSEIIGWIWPEKLKDMAADLQQWADADQMYVVKTHMIPPDIEPLLANGSAKICYVYRDIRDVAVSVKRKFKKDDDELYALLDKATATYFTVKQMPGVIWQRYEAMMENLYGEVDKLAEELNLNASPQIIQRIAQQWGTEGTRQAIQQLQRKRQLKIKLRGALRRLKLEKPAETLIKQYQPDFSWDRIYDTKHLLHIDHIANTQKLVGNWQTELTATEVDDIVERYRDYLVDAHYL
ncbi:MAG: sulfotransferase domain-containing protein [Cyanobacteria bacterium J06639_16]